MYTDDHMKSTGSRWGMRGRNLGTTGAARTREPRPCVHGPLGSSKLRVDCHAPIFDSRARPSMSLVSHVTSRTECSRTLAPPTRATSISARRRRRRVQILQGLSWSTASKGARV